MFGDCAYGRATHVGRATHIHRATQIEGTPVHPVWVINRAAFVPLAELQIGDLVDTLDGPQPVTQVTLEHRPAPVYNIEVQAQHVYRIASLGVLVHNTDPGDCTDLVQITAPKGPIRELATSVDGRLKDLVPDSVPKQWGKNQIEDAIQAVEESLRVRRAEVVDYAVNQAGGKKWQKIAHDKRIVLEENFLRQLRGALGDM